MAGSRRGGPPDIRGTLGTLLKTTLYQVGLVKDAVERQARSQRGWLDGAMLQRKRREALAALGEAIYELCGAGELGELDDIPEIAQALADIESIDERIADSEAGGDGPGAAAARRKGAADSMGGAVSSAEWAATRQRFDRSDRRGGGEAPRVWRPVAEKVAGGEPSPGADGGEGERGPGRSRRAGAPTAAPPGRRRRPARSARGGIAFVDDDPDDDLEEYMNPEDVPDSEPGDR